MLRSFLSFKRATYNLEPRMETDIKYPTTILAGTGTYHGGIGSDPDIKTYRFHLRDCRARDVRAARNHFSASVKASPVKGAFVHSIRSHFQWSPRNADSHEEPYVKNIHATKPRLKECFLRVIGRPQLRCQMGYFRASPWGWSKYLKVIT